MAAVLAIAGITKLADRRGLQTALVDFGVPSSLIKPTSALLPVAELAAAVALVPAFSARWAALGALGLLGLFSAAVVGNLLRGRQPDCHCFGQLHSAPVGVSTLVRNALLAALAGVIAWREWSEPGFSITPWLRQLSGAEMLGFVAAMMAVGLVALQGWIVLHLLRQHGRLLVRIDNLEAALGSGAATSRSHSASDDAGLPVGTQAPEFGLVSVHGETLTLGTLRSAGKPVLLLFTSPGCGPCESLMPEVGTWQRDRDGAVTVGIISAGPPDAIAAVAGEHGLRNVLRQEAWEVAESYHYRGTPSAVVVSPDGRIATPLVAGPDPIRSLFSRTVGGESPLPVDLGRVNGNGHGRHQHRHEPLPAPSVGEPAPNVQLPDPAGKRHDLAEFLDNTTLVLFWDPACGFCEQMLDDLKRWEERPPPGSPELLVISAGSAEVNKAMGLRSPILLDERSEAMHAFGASGTPMGVLVDSGARIASRLTVGATAVLALADGAGGNAADEAPERDRVRTADG